ncbi:MAG: transcription elongation factor GreB [Sandaracinaceae bacterium]|nr:transcription elongation factor GreB [Sandaracinaceae bacterium]
MAQEDKQYITPDGHRRLVAELERLGDERQRVVKGVADAAAEGDRSENAEYIYGKKRLREIDKRMRFLRKVVEGAVVVDPRQDRGDRIFFGATVVLEDDAGAEVVYQLVGEHETEADKGRISYRSPVGAALMRKEEGDAVSVRTPNGLRRFTIVEVRYE